MKTKVVVHSVPVYANESFSYVKSSEIPESLKEDFRKWMFGQTCSYIDNEIVYYSWDWERFVSGKPIID